MSLAYDFTASDTLPADGEAMPDNVLPFEQQPPDPVEQLLRWADPRQTINIADELEPSLLGAIGQRVVREYEVDDQTRADWLDQTRTAIELAMQVTKQKDYPWPKAANVIFPLMTTAAMQFAARAYPAIVNGRNVVKGVVIGDDSGQAPVDENGQPITDPQTGQPAWVIPPNAKRDRADRIGEHMSWQLLEEQPEWEPETDKLLHILPIVGCVFRKSYFDSGKGRNCSHMVPAQNLVIGYHAKSLELAPRITEIVKLYPQEIEERKRAGVFLEDFEPGSAPGVSDDDDAPHEFLEQHRWLDLDADGYKEPYIVTVHKEKAQVVRIVARYEAEGIKARPDGKIVKIDPVHYYTQYDFLPNPDGGIYGTGFGQLLRPVNEAVNSTLNQLLDAGHLANTSGGFIAKGLSMHTGSVKFGMGEYKSVNATGADIKNSIVPITFPGPSPVLFNLLEKLIEAGKEIASIKDVLSGDLNSQTMQPTTALAMIEQGLKVFTAIYKRVHRSLKAELEKLYRLNRVYMNEQSEYKIGDEWKNITRADYEHGSGVEPISDPGMVSDMQRMARAQFIQSMMELPTIKTLEATRRVLDAAQIEDIDKLLNENPPPDPQVIAHGLELELRDREVTTKENLSKAQEAQAITAAVKNLADAAVAAQGSDVAAQMAWINAQMEAYRIQLEAANAGKDGEGAGGGRVPSVAQPPGDIAVPPVPPGLPGGAGPGGDAAMGGGGAPPLV